MKKMFRLRQQAKAAVTAALGDTLADTRAGLHTHTFAHTHLPLTAYGGCSQRQAWLHAGPH